MSGGGAKFEVVLSTLGGILKQQEEIRQTAEDFVRESWDSGDLKITGLYAASQLMADKYMPTLGPKPRFHETPAWPWAIWLMFGPVAIFVPAFFGEPTGLTYFVSCVVWTVIFWAISGMHKSDAFNKNEAHRRWVQADKKRSAICEEFDRVAMQAHGIRLREHEQRELEEREAQELEDARRRPQPIEHCTHQQAEYLAALWMKHLGETDAKVSQATRDGGIDVESAHFVVEVKHHAAAIGPVPVRALAGVAYSKKKVGAFFSRSGYSKDAMKFALDAGVLLFKYDPEAGTLNGMTPVSTYAVKHGLQAVLQSAKNS